MWRQSSCGVYLQNAFYHFEPLCAWMRIKDHIQLSSETATTEKPHEICTKNPYFPSTTCKRKIKQLNSVVFNSSAFH